MSTGWIVLGIIVILVLFAFGLKAMLQTRAPPSQARVDAVG